METGWSVFCLLLLENTRYRYTLVREREEVARKKPQRVRLFISKCPDIKNTNRIKETGVSKHKRKRAESYGLVAIALSHKVSHRDVYLPPSIQHWNIFFFPLFVVVVIWLIWSRFCSGKMLHYNSDATVVVWCIKKEREREPPAIVSFYLTVTGCWRSRSNQFTSAL